MNCNSTLTAPPCAQPMSTAEQRLWGVAGVLIVVIVITVNWWSRAVPAIPPFSHL